MQYALHKYFKLSRVHNVMFGLLEGSSRAPGVPPLDPALVSSTSKVEASPEQPVPRPCSCPAGTRCLPCARSEQERFAFGQTTPRDCESVSRRKPSSSSSCRSWPSSFRSCRWCCPTHPAQTRCRPSSPCTLQFQFPPSRYEFSRN